MASHIGTRFEVIEGKDIYIVDIKRSETLKFVEKVDRSGGNPPIFNGA